MLNDFEQEDTKPINFQQLILQHLSVISADIKDIKLTLECHDHDLSSLRGQVNLAGNFAAEARDNSDEALKTIRRIDQNLSGIYELAKSGYDIATAVKSTMDSFRPEPDSSPEIIIDNGWVMAE